MDDAQIIDVDHIVDTRRLNPFHVLVVILGILILTVDGMDFSSANVAAPQIMKAFSVSRSVMGNVLAAGNFGILLGSLTFGFISDVYGRRAGVIASVFFYSLPAIAVAFATSVDHLMVLRFIAGLGVGGVVPPVVALLNESAPRRLRATFVLFGFIGYSIGNFVSGTIASSLIPTYGWQTPFLVAGIVGVVLAFVLLAILPESVKFLCIRDPFGARTHAALRRVAPGVAIDPGARLVVQTTTASHGFRQLFAGDRRLITLLLWLCFFAESLTFVTLLSWLVVLLRDAGISAHDAPLVFAAGAVGGMIGMIFVGPLTDRFGLLTTVATAVVGVMSILLVGAHISHAALVAIAVLAFAAAQVTHNSLYAMVGMFYGTDIRGKGVGWAAGSGRVALTLGPLGTGYLLAAKMPRPNVLDIIAAPYLVVICVCLVLSFLHRAQTRAAIPGMPTPPDLGFHPGPDASMGSRG
jgi:AAHS family 4-hydroxybenzoate transporter-like MFS transporter